MLDCYMLLTRYRVGYHLSISALAFFGEPFESISRMQDLGLRLGNRLALFHGQSSGDVIGALAHQIGRFLEDLGSIIGGEFHPALHREMSGFERPFDFDATAEGHL